MEWVRRTLLVALLANGALSTSGCTNRPFSMASLRISGNSAMSEDVLRAGAHDCASAEDCAAVLEGVYFDEGYVTARVEPTKSFVQRITSSYSSLTVEEGPRFTTSAVEIVEAGATDALGDPAQLAALSRVAIGGPFLRRELSETYRGIAKRYEEAGFEQVLIVPVTDIDTTSQSVKVRLEITRGPP